MSFLIFFVALVIVIGTFCVVCDLEDDVSIVCIFSAIFVLIGILGGFDLKDFWNNNSYNTQYLPAEPLAYNQTQTIFTTDKGAYTANGLYPDGTYMLTVDGDNVLVVWQAVEGGEG